MSSQDYVLLIQELIPRDSGGPRSLLDYLGHLSPYLGLPMSLDVEHSLCCDHDSCP